MKCLLHLIIFGNASYPDTVKGKMHLSVNSYVFVDEICKVILKSEYFA